MYTKCEFILTGSVRMVRGHFDNTLFIVRTALKAVLCPGLVKGRPNQFMFRIWSMTLVCGQGILIWKLVKHLKLTRNWKLFPNTFDFCCR